MLYHLSFALSLSSTEASLNPPTAADCLDSAAAAAVAAAAVVVVVSGEDCSVVSNPGTLDCCVSESGDSISAGSSSSVRPPQFVKLRLIIIITTTTITGKGKAKCVLTMLAMDGHGDGERVAPL